MANTNQKKDALAGIETEVGLHTALRPPVNPGAGNADPNNLLAQLLLRKLQKEREEEEQAAEARKRQMQRNLEMVQQQIAAKNAEQSACSHTKENGKAAIGGQKLQNGHFTFLCVRCQKEFDETTLPPHLAASLAPGSIGGAY